MNLKDYLAMIGLLFIILAHNNAKHKETNEHLVQEHRYAVDKNREILDSISNVQWYVLDRLNKMEGKK